MADPIPPRPAEAESLPWPRLFERRAALVAGPGQVSAPGRRPWGQGGLFQPDGRADPLTRRVMAEGARLAPERRDRADVLPEAIFCGRFKPHFGHFLAESIGRLWAVGQLGPDLPLVWFAEPHVGPRPSGTAEEALRLLGIANPVVIVREALRVTRLHVPPTLNDPVLGLPAAPAFQAWLAARLDAAGLPAAGGGRLYLSRSGLADAMGRYLGESALESGLAAEGYRVLRPEALPLAAQIAEYRAARQVVLAEGSALHLLALLDVPGQRLAMVMRRPRLMGTIPPAEASFRRARIDRIERIVAAWRDPASTVPGYQAVSELDMAGVWADLARLGFVTRADGLPVPDAAALTAERLARAANRNVPWQPGPV